MSSRWPGLLLALAAPLFGCGRVSYGVLVVAPAEDASMSHVDAVREAVDAVDSCAGRVRFDEVGAGTEVDPFLVCNEAQLRSLSGVGAGAFLRLTSDIALSAMPFEPIGGTLGFSGTLDGDGHTVSGLVVQAASSAEAGLIATASRATVRDLTVLGADVRGDSLVGILVGAGVGMTIEGVRVEGRVEGTRFIGGLAGQLRDSRVTEVRAEVAVTAYEQFAGGAIGRQELGTSERIFVTGTVRVDGTEPERCRYVGGVTADLQQGTVTRSAADVVLTNSGAVTGGIVGWSTLGTVTDVYSMGSGTGGLAGVAPGGVVDPERYFCSGPVWSYVGGIVGASLGGATERAWSSMRLTGAAPNVGGVVAQNVTAGGSRGRVANVFAAGALSEPGGRGTGAVTELLDAEVREVYWDTSVGITRQCGGTCRDLLGGAGIDGAAMPEYFRTRENPPLSAWDFDAVWMERSGDYPTLLGLPAR